MTTEVCAPVMPLSPSLTTAVPSATLSSFAQFKPQMKPYAEMTWQLLTTLETISELARLPHNWDGYGSRPIRQGSIRSARRLLAVIDREMPPTPHIAPVAGGGIQISWQHKSRELEVALHPNGTVDYITVDNGTIEDGDDEPLALDDDVAVQDLIRWLLGKQDKQEL